MKKLFVLLFTSLFAVTSFAKEIKIGITQFVSHPTLDQVRRGIIAGLAEEGYHPGENLQIKYKNANGNIVVSSQIAKQFASHDLDVVVAITTPSAHAAKKALRSKKPLVFATVTDPVSAGLVKSLSNQQDNVTGTRNPLALGKQLTYLKEILPNVQKLGVLVNHSEDNSVALLKHLQEIAPNFNIKIFPASVKNSAEVSVASKSLIGKVDAIFLLQDNTMASALSSLVKIANKNKIPLFSSFIEGVEQGALAGLAYDEYEIGVQTGKLAARVIKQGTANGIAVEDPAKLTKMINSKTSRVLGINIK